MIIVGIDPGVSGAISVLENKKVLDVYEMPTMIDGKKNKKQVNGSQVANIIKERIKANNEIAAASSKKWIQQITQSMPVGAGEISTEAEEECTKADTIVKANVPPSPAVQRVQNTETQAAETKKPDTPATAEERALSGDYTLEDTFITEYLKKANPMD